MRQRLLVTGFGAFPGAPVNPTASILRRLVIHKPRLSRLGIGLECVLVPVVYAEVAPVLARAIALHQPDAILHLGLASRRRHISVETRAVNRASPLHADARGAVPTSQVLTLGGPACLVATYQATPILAAIRRKGLAAHRSIDAGDYICNATLYGSLREKTAPQIGFLHVPRGCNPAVPKARAKGRKPSIEALTQATLAALLVMAQRTALRSRTGAQAAPTALPTADAPATRPQR